MESPKRASPKELGEMLVEANLITEEQLGRVRELQTKDGDKIERILLQQRLITPQQLAFFTSLQLQIPFVNLKQEGVQPQAIALIPESVARRYNAIPVDMTDTTVVVAMDDPRNIQAIEDLTALTRRRVEPVLSTTQDIQEMIDLNYRVGSEIEEQLSQIPTRYQRTKTAEPRLSAL
jgi:type IV pilus assembly protein PilB